MDCMNTHPQTKLQSVVSTQCNYISSNPLIFK